jgi:hypothetical protein
MDGGRPESYRGQVLLIVVEKGEKGAHTNTNEGKGKDP